MNDCKDCYNYKKSSCPLFELNDVDKIKTREYVVDCWRNEYDEKLCELLCDEVKMIKNKRNLK